MTIKEAAIKVLRDAGQALSIDEIYDRICSEGLFEFKAKSPKAVLSRQLRSHAEGVEMKLASAEKCFRITSDKKFTLI
ncbi:winged helix-turn-helix domain-containing protein [Haloferula sp.]|uniref:winged helix-turn-helix domain-containing protein n=1 Tax=Haloferula sp. TaxID=2497595 RepID=UPI003C72B2D6